jgi:hypothetical protein
MRGFQFAELMKCVSVAAVLATTVIFVTQAHAADPAEEVVPSTSSSLSVPSPSSEAVSSEATSVTKLPESAPVAKRKLKVAFFSQQDFSMGDLANDEVSKNGVLTENYVALNYALGETQTVGIRQYFLYTYSKLGAESGEAHIDNTAINYVNSKLIDFGNDMTVSTVVRYYAPTGESSRMNTLDHGNALNVLNLTKTIGKFDLSAAMVSRFWIQSQNSYLTSTAKPDGKVEFTEKENLDYELNPFVGVDYNLSKKVTFSMSVGADNVWWHAVAGKELKRGHYLDIIPSITYVPASNLTLIFNVENYADIYRPAAFSLFRTDEIYPHVILSASI